MLEVGCDDLKLFNQRCLVLLGKLIECMFVGIVFFVLLVVSQMQSLGQDSYLLVQSYLVVSCCGFFIDGVDSQGSWCIVQLLLVRGKLMFVLVDEFIVIMLLMVQKVVEWIGVDVCYLVVQVVLEIGWGKLIICQQDGGSSYNLFGIKIGSCWDGVLVCVFIIEYEGGKVVKEVVVFCFYLLFEQSFYDYVSFFQGNDCYQNVLDSVVNFECFMQELQCVGYVIDLQYVCKVVQIVRQMQIYQVVVVVGMLFLG